MDKAHRKPSEIAGEAARQWLVETGWVEEAPGSWRKEVGTETVVTTMAGAVGVEWLVAVSFAAIATQRTPVRSERESALAAEDAATVGLDSLDALGAGAFTVAHSMHAAYTLAARREHPRAGPVPARLRHAVERVIADRDREPN